MLFIPRKSGTRKTRRTMRSARAAPLWERNFRDDRHHLSRRPDRDFRRCDVGDHERPGGLDRRNTGVAENAGRATHSGRRTRVNPRDPSAVAEGPLVSVIVPAHNAQTTIERALRSVRLQDYPNIEVIVVDDASIDETALKVKTFAGLPVRLKSTGRQLGAAGARNLG